MRLLVRAPGCPNFAVDIDSSSTVGDAKVEITSGCDIDPNEMRLVYRGKVLNDDAAVLLDLGLKEGETLHIARGRPANSPVPSPLADVSTMGTEQISEQSVGKTFRLSLRVPGGSVLTLDGLSSDEPLVSVRALAGARCNLAVEQVRLLIRGRILPDDNSATLATCGVTESDTLYVARRATQQDQHEQAPSAALPGTGTFAPAEAAGAPMPMAWGGNGGLAGLGALGGAHGLTEQELRRMAAEVMAVGGAPEQAMRHMQDIARAGPDVRGDYYEARLHRETQMMQRQVRHLAAFQLAGGAPGRPAPSAERLDEVERQIDEECPDLLVEIARTMAEARARGAPVPNAAIFVDRAVAQARASRAHRQQLDREMSGLQPEVEDALAAAEIAAAAAARMPRKLGSE